MKKEKTDWHLLRRMFGYVAPHWPLAGLGILLILVYTVSSAIGLFTLKPIIDGILVRPKVQTVAPKIDEKRVSATAYLKTFSGHLAKTTLRAVQGEESFLSAKSSVRTHFNDFLEGSSVDSQASSRSRVAITQSS